MIENTVDTDTGNFQRWWHVKRRVSVVLAFAISLLVTFHEPGSGSDTRASYVQ